MADESERTALYRLYDKDGALLYVGITGNPEKRFAQHAADKDWWPFVASRTIEWYDSRSGAEGAEQAAIKAHVPLHNHVHSPEPPVKLTVELSAAQLRGIDILRRALTPAAYPPFSREDWLWCLVDRELSARGLLGDPPCYATTLGWPDGITLAECPVPGTHCCPGCPSPPRTGTNYPSLVKHGYIDPAA